MKKITLYFVPQIVILFALLFVAVPSASALTFPDLNLYAEQNGVSQTVYFPKLPLDYGIFYTTDGSDPLTSSTVKYDAAEGGSIQIISTTTIKAVLVRPLQDGLVYGSVNTFYFKLQ